MSPTQRRASTFAIAGACLLVVTGCAQTREAPTPGMSQGTPPDLRGIRVMVLPVQDVRGVTGDPDAELAFGLQDRGEGVLWVLPPRLQEVLDRAPGMDTRLRGLAVGVFSAAEVRRVGDPLYGQLRRLATLVDAEVALIPVRAWVGMGGDGPTPVMMAAALVHIRTGRVMWFGVVEGDPHPTRDPRALASAVDMLARTLFWYVSG